MAITGAIAERTRSIFPITWDALLDSRQYGDTLLQNVITTVKERIFGEVVLPSLEAQYPYIVIDYAAKHVALELITPAIDYWMSHPYVVSTTGTSEQSTYSERAEHLRRLREDLLRDIQKLEPIVEPLIGIVHDTNSARPASNTTGDEFLTPSPQEFARPWRATNWS